MREQGRNSVFHSCEGYLVMVSPDWGSWLLLYTGPSYRPVKSSMGIRPPLMFYPQTHLLRVVYVLSNIQDLTIKVRRISGCLGGSLG